ncbi:MAG: hypothetical protein KJ804_09100 [Proteobacteria bacterium]|nr:hypothetical protein [Pseudomonadota bacterium]MBU1058456.1 hypothetical protein [Pseudomonadota bacterium]
MPGKPVTMDKDLAEPLLKKGVLSIPEQQAPTEITEETIIAAISKLDPMNATLWTGDNKPQIPALEAILKGKISAKERDNAWDRYQKQTV